MTLFTASPMKMEMRSVNVEVRPPTAQTRKMNFFSLFRYFRAKTSGENTDSALFRFILHSFLSFYTCS